MDWSILLIGLEHITDLNIGLEPMADWIGAHGWIEFEPMTDGIGAYDRLDWSP